MTSLLACATRLCLSVWTCVTIVLLFLIRHFHETWKLVAFGKPFRNCLHGGAWLNQGCIVFSSNGGRCGPGSILNQCRREPVLANPG